MADTSTLGSLLQGVSQQPAHIRADGQVSVQDNMISSVTRGITSRPGAEKVNVNTTTPAGLTYKKFRLNGQNYQVGTSTGQAYILDDRGEELPLEMSPEAASYIGNDMDVYVYDNKDTKIAYLLNRDKIVETLSDTSAAEAEVITDIGLVTCLGGLFNHEYSVTIEYPNGTKATGSYKTPFGVEDGDAFKSSASYIAQQLADALRTGQSVNDFYVNDTVASNGFGINVIREVLDETSVHVNGQPLYTSTTPVTSGTTVTAVDNVIMIRGVPGIKITVDDGSGGDSIVSQTSVAKSTDDLAALAPHGTLVKVIGLDGTEDDFWMRFEIDGQDTVGEGFGSEGLWREWYNPFEVHELDNTTMPFEMVPLDNGGFRIEPTEWEHRRTGDEETNPLPGFVGKAIRDINGFQQRLVFVSGPLASMSVTNGPQDFFKKSAVQEVATDPIEIISTAQDEFSLQYIIPFDRDLVIFGDDNQFLITGGDGLTTSNASMVQTTNFEMSRGARPVSTGQTVLFPFLIGKFSGIKEFFSNNSADANEAVTVSQTVPEYVKGRITDLQLSTNFDTLLIRTDDPESQNVLWIYKYLWDGERKVQSAWSRWVMPYSVEHVFFDDTRIAMLLRSPQGLIQARLDLDIPNHPDLPYPLCVDLYEPLTVPTEEVDPVTGIRSVTLSLDVPEPVFVQGAGCPYPGREIKVVTDGTSHTFPVGIAPEGSEVLVGTRLNQTFTPTMPFARDRNGLVMRFVRLVVSRFLIHYEESGPMSATKSSRFRSKDTVISTQAVSTYDDPRDPLGIGLRSDVFSVPFGEQSDRSQLTIKSSGPLPVSINEIEWVGQSRGGKRRV